MPNPAAIIIGAGDATGGAIARAFAAEGLTACVTRRERHADALEALAATIRDAGHRARAFPADARDEAAMIALFDQVDQPQHDGIEMLVHHLRAPFRGVGDLGAQCGIDRKSTRLNSRSLMRSSYAVV